MYDQSYYSNLMIKWNGLKESSVLEVEKYEILVKELKTLKENFQDIEYNLIDAEKKYLDGGFLDKEITFDKGELKDCYTILNTKFFNILGFITRYEAKILSLTQNINEYESNYYFAKKNYYECLNKKEVGS